MAGPQFLTPQPVSATRPRRRFTLAQANATLPLVRRIVADIVTSHARVAALQGALDGAGKDQPKVQGDLQRALEHLQDYVDELTDIGCELKDYQAGLIDFIGRHENRDVCLCWKLGEDSIAWWHEVQDGFPGRQPVAILRES